MYRSIRIVSKKKGKLVRSITTGPIIDPWNSLISSRTMEISQSGGRKLDGTTFIAKDNIASKKESVSCGSKMLENYRSPFDATVITLLEDEGSILVGKSNLDEFGMGSSTTYSYFGPAINPLYEKDQYITGGSSGGSAAAISAGLATFSLGTDTGGSVRLPASYCGVIGFKPTYGRISRWGIVPYAQTLDTVGIFANEIKTVERVYATLNRYDSKDPTSLPGNLRNEIKPSKKSMLTIGIPKEFIIDELSREIKENWLQTLRNLQKMGHTIRTVSIPSIKKSLSAYYTLATAEAASNLSRYDGVRYGYSTPEVKSSSGDLIAENRSTAFGPEVQRRIILGNYTLSSVSGNHYLKATQVRNDLVNEFNEVFNKSHILLDNKYKDRNNRCDLLISPTSIGNPPTIEEYLNKENENFLNSYINDILTIPASLAGLPAISIPINNKGIQIMGQFGDDEAVLDISKLLLNYE